MKYYKLSIKEDNKIKVGDESSEGGVNYTVNDIDDSTGTVSWKVEYETDFLTTYNKIQEALKTINDLRLELDNGSLFNETMGFIEKAKYSYRKVLKRDFPKAYKKLMNGKISEISTSGAAGPYQGKTIYRLKK